MPDSVTYTSGDTYRFRLEKDLTIQFPAMDFGRHRYEDDQGREWLSLQGHSWTIKAGYATDGASPKFRVAGKWIGTPDPEATRMASIWHDSAFQFLNVPCFPVNRKWADSAFLEIMRANGFKFAPLYYNAVRLFGGFFAAKGRYDTGLTCSICGPHRVAK